MSDEFIVKRNSVLLKTFYLKLKNLLAPFSLRVLSRIRTPTMHMAPPAVVMVHQTAVGTICMVTGSNPCYSPAQTSMVIPC